MSGRFVYVPGRRDYCEIEKIKKSALAVPLHSQDHDPPPATFAGWIIITIIAYCRSGPQVIYDR